MSDVTKIGSFEIVPVQSQLRRMSMLVWGLPGCGKTTLCATAPGKKLLINFDPDGASSIGENSDVDVLDVSRKLATAGQLLSGSLMASIRPHLAKYDSVIVDSLTNVADAALTVGIAKTKGATLERPSPGAYGVRNAYTMAFIKDVLSETAVLNKHCFFTAHEDVPEKNEEGAVVSVTLMLGGKLPSQGPASISEVWWMRDDGVKRHIAVRPVRKRAPMKTRMFITTDTPEFVWSYNSDKQTGDGLSEWFAKWEANSFNKVPLPK
jgi:hypothetical protein